MPERVTIYIPKLEGTERVARSARAEWLGANRYRILTERPADEIWAFETGSIVIAERRGGLLRALADGGARTPAIVEERAAPAPLVIEEAPDIDLSDAEEAPPFAGPDAPIEEESITFAAGSTIDKLRARPAPVLDNAPLVPWWGWAVGTVVVGILIVLIARLLAD